MDIIMRNRKIEDISILEAFQNDGEENKPLIIFYHGGSGQKEDGLFPAFNLARRGYHVVLPDIVRHGERKGMGDYLYITDVILRTADEVNKIISSFEQDRRVNTRRVGLGGISMGAMITFKYITGRDMRVKAAVALIGSPEWVSICSCPLVESTVKSIYPDYTEEDRIKDLEMTARVQPINDYPAMTRAALLVQNGEADEIVPVEKVREFFAKLMEIHENKEQLKLVTYPDVGHTYTAEMEKELIHWFEKYV